MGDEEKQSKIGTGKEEDVNTSDGSLDLCHNDSVTGSVVDTLRERVKELEALVGGKEEALHVALQGLDSAMGVEVEYRAQLEGCRARVGEFQQAVQHRDQLIEQLSASLEHTLRARDELAQDGERLAQEVSLLRSQLQATSELVAQGSSKSQHDFMLLQNRMLALEDTSKKKDARIEELQRLLSEEQGAKKELEQKKGELTQYKSQAATHVQQLMQEVERLHREAVNSKTLERQRAQQVVGLEREHQRQLAELRAELEEQFGQQLMHIQENHRIQFSEQVLKQHQSEEVASISVTTTTSSNDSDTQQQLQELSERALHVASEREDLVNQLALYKGQVQSLSEELLKYSSETNDSQQSLRVSLESENVSLKEQLHLLKEKLRTVEEDKTQELVMYQQAQASEVATWRKRVDSLTLELQKVSEVAESYLLRLEECTKVHETEITSLQEAHAKELAFLSGQMEGMKQFKVEVARLQEKLQEQTVMEKRLQNELETSIRAEETLKGKLLEIQEERQVLRSAFEQQKELLHQQANNVEKLRNELQEKERSELSLREELKVLTDKITSAREGDAKLYKEQIDKLNEQLQQKVKTEELLKKQVLEREQVEQMLKKELEEQTDKYKLELNSVKQVLQEKVQIEDQLRTELQEKVREGVLLQNELEAQKCALEELKKSTGEAEVYKTQVDSLNRQLQERSQSEHKIISDYESRVKALTFDLNTIESRLSSEVQDIQARAREELSSKQETERRLEGELEAVRNELLTLKTLPDVQEYKEQINKLNLLVQEKQKAEAALKAELQAVSAEVAALKENQQHLENFNSDLEERLRTEQRLQEELIAAAKMHKEQVDVLSAKINELTSQQNSLDNEAISMRQEIESQKSYIHDLELIREQVSQSAKTKEVLINDLSVCVKSLTEDNASYQLKLDHLNKRLDDECHRADENMMMREGYEKEISKHKQHIEELKNNLQEALKTRDLHLIEISECQQELKGYKEQLETLNNTFEEETSRLRQEYVQKMDEKRKRAEELGKELVDMRKKVSSYKEQIEKLNEIATKKEKAEAINKKEMAELNKELLEVKNNLEEKKNQIEKLQAKLTHVEDCQSKDVTMYTNKIRDLEAEISVKNEHIGKLNVQMEESACKFDDVNKLLLQAQQQFVQERENNAGLLWEKMGTDAKSRKPEDQVVEVEEQMQNVSAMQAGLQELNVTQEKSPKDRDSLNFSSISETELLQLESKLQHALNEKNDIEKSFRDHINKLAENHQKEVNLYEEQLQAVHKKLEELMKTHSQCESEKESLKTEIDKLLIDHEKTSSYKDKLKVTFEKLEELSQVHRSCHSEQEALKNLITGLEKDQKEKDDLLLEAGRKYEQLSTAHGGCVSEKENFTAHINKLSARYENEITEYVQQLKEASEKIDELSRSNANCLAENGSLKESLTKMTEVCEEVALYKDQLRITNERLEEISKIHTECVSVKDSFVRKVSEQEMTLQDQESVLQKKSEALDACQKDLTRTREYIELLKVNLQDEISKVRVELHNLVNICAPNNETMNEEDNKQKSSEESSFMNGKDNWSPDWSQKEGHGSLEQSFVSAATIHHDVSALRSHVERLVSDLHSIKQKSSATEGLLAAKEENEIILKKHIDHLQKELGKIDEEKKSSKEQLEELTVKFLTAQSLLAGKTEAESSLQKEVAEMEVGACNKCKNLEEEISRLNSKLLDSEEKLRNIERERDKIVNKYKQSEKDKEKLLEEKADLANAIEQLKTENSHATNGAESEGLLKMSENSQNNLVLQYNVLLDEHRKLLAEKSRVEELLEERKAELVRMREQQNEISSTAGELRHEGMGVEKGTQEQLDSVKEEAACVQLRESSVSSSNLSTSLDFLDLGVRGLEESDAADAATVHAAGDAASSLKPNRSLHAVVLKLMQHCAVLDAAKRTLISECDALRGRLEEREAQELLFNEELAAANSRCEALELRLQDAQQQEPTREALAGAKMALQCELRALEGENCALKAAKVSLQDELLSLREELQHLKKMGSRNSDPKGLAQELAVKVTEASILQEKLKVTERESQVLQAHVEALEKTKQDMLKQFEMFLEDARRTREQLEAAWQEQADAEEQLGRTRCELAIAGLRRESKASGLDSSAVALPDAGESPVFHLHQEVHTMVEEMAHELVSLRRELQSERTRNEHMVLERSCTEEPLEMERKLKALMKSNLELLQEKQSLLDQLQKQQAHTLAQSSSSQEGPTPEVDLLAQLSVYREQHVSLAEAIGSTGALQEALRQQKEELLALVQAKGSVEEQLATERAEAQSSRLRLQLLEQQLQEKDLLHQELFQQKCNLQAELQQLEDKLREREQMLQIQRVQLQAELRAQEMRLRRWQLQQRASEVERKLDESLRESPGSEEAQKEADTSATELQGHLQTLREEMHRAHREAVARLKQHLDAEFSAREQALRAGFSAEMASAQATHREQLAKLQHALLSADKELERLRNADLARTLGNAGHMSTELSAAKERYEQELHTICSGLDEGQAHLFAVLKHLFEEFARQLVAGTTNVLQSQNEQLVEREVATLTSHHQQQLECLRATLEKEHLKTLQELEEKHSALLTENNEEVATKLLLNVSTGVQLHSADSSQVALVQLKHLLYSEYTSALREVTKDWASAWKEEVRSQLEALEKALEEEAMALQLLRDSPEVQGSGTRDPGTSKTSEELLHDAEKLTTRAEELLERKVKVAEQALRVVSERLDAAFAPVAERTKQMASTHQISRGTNSTEGEAEKDQYRKLAQQLAAEHAAEAGRLRELLAQLEARRAREMEELRQYFEQKVQELEKHYSEEITSQHSRRHSSSSCDSDSEFTADALLGAGDHALNRIPPLTHICDSCAADPGYKELEERWKGELEKRVEESRSQLLAAKKELEAHYETELSTLRKKYEEKLGRLAQELSGAQQAAVQVAKASAGKCLQALWRKEVRAARTRLLALLSQNSPDSPIYSQAEESLDGKAESFESISNLVENDAQDQETLEDLCIELSSQLRQLEATCRQCLLKQKQQLQKVKEAHTEFAVEEASTQSVEQVLSKVQLEEKLRREVRQELEQELEQQVEKVSAMMKANAEQEQNMFIENQNQMMKEFLEQHRYDLESLKQQHRAELSKVRGGDRTIGMTQTDALSLMRRHETSQTDQPKTPNRTDAAVSPKHFVKLHKQVQTEEPEPANVLMASQEVQTSPRKGSPALLDVSTDRLRAQPFDGNSLSLLSDVVSLMEPAPEDGAEDEQEGADFRRTLMNIQSEYVNHLEAMLLEWLRLYQKMKNGQILGESDAKFLTREYVLDCCSKFKSVLSNLESIHLSEISNLQAALQRQRSSSRSPYNIQDDCNDELISPDKFAALIQERDHWRRVGLVLKKLVEELLTYLSECEDEVNQTLLSEGGVVQEENWALGGPPTAEEVGPTNSGPAMATPKRTPKRVRFAPTSFNFKDLVGNDDQMLLDVIREDEDLSGKLRAELDVCLEHLRAEAAALMENPLAGGQWAMDSTPSTPIQNTQTEGGQIEALAQALTAAKQRIAHLETERRLEVRSEEVAEGFGEQPSSSQQGAALGLRLQSLSQLQDKARSMLAEGRPSSPQEAQQLRLLDEICREGDRLAEEARREREDLRQQVPPPTSSPDLPLAHSVCCACCLKVESADKRLRDTRRFLEEQAAEREQERDEFQQELLRLQEQLKAREKDLADQQRLSREVEALEQQGKEALARHQQLEAHREALQVELKAAVDKVWLLRDVVAELELQAEAKDARAAHLEARVQELQEALHEQENARQQLSDELESLRAEGGSEISRQVAALQEQLHAHRLQAEQCRPAAIKQMKAQIREMEVNVEKRTHQLEALHATSSNQSSPSEDVSVRDMFRSDSPEDMRAASASLSLAGSMGSSPRSPPPVPLPVRELSRLQERLQRHARAEEAALKKTRDLEMQLKAARRAEEEASAERDVLQERVSEQLLRIASLEALVDAGRWKRTSEEEEAVELEELREQQLLQQRAQDAEDEAERLAVELDGVRQELQHLKEANAEAEAAWAERERTLGAQLLIAQRAEAAAAMRCAALQKEGPQQKALAVVPWAGPRGGAGAPLLAAAAAMAQALAPASLARRFPLPPPAPALLRRRSEGRLKRLASAEDARAWASSPRARRDHLVQLVAQAYEPQGAAGSVVPPDVLMETLLADKNAEIDSLRRRLTEAADAPVSQRAMPPPTRSQDTQSAICLCKPDGAGADRDAVEKGVAEVARCERLLLEALWRLEEAAAAADGRPPTRAPADERFWAPLGAPPAPSQASLAPAPRAAPSPAPSPGAPGVASAAALDVDLGLEVEATIQGETYSASIGLSVAASASSHQGPSHVGQAAPTPSAASVASGYKTASASSVPAASAASMPSATPRPCASTTPTAASAARSAVSPAASVPIAVKSPSAASLPCGSVTPSGSIVPCPSKTRSAASAARSAVSPAASVPIAAKTPSAASMPCGSRTPSGTVVPCPSKTPSAASAARSAVSPAPSAPVAPKTPSAASLPCGSRTPSGTVVPCPSKTPSAASAARSAVSPAASVPIAAKTPSAASTVRSAVTPSAATTPMIAVQSPSAASMPCGSRTPSGTVVPCPSKTPSDRSAVTPSARSLPCGSVTPSGSIVPCPSKARSAASAARSAVSPAASVPIAAKTPSAASMPCGSRTPSGTVVPCPSKTPSAASAARSAVSPAASVPIAAKTPSAASMPCGSRTPSGTVVPCPSKTPSAASAARSAVSPAASVPIAAKTPSAASMPCGSRTPSGTVVPCPSKTPSAASAARSAVSPAASVPIAAKTPSAASMPCGSRTPSGTVVPCPSKTPSAASAARSAVSPAASVPIAVKSPSAASLPCGSRTPSGTVVPCPSKTPSAASAARSAASPAASVPTTAKSPSAASLPSGARSASGPAAAKPCSLSSMGSSSVESFVSAEEAPSSEVCVCVTCHEGPAFRAAAAATASASSPSLSPSSSSPSPSSPSSSASSEVCVCDVCHEGAAPAAAAAALASSVLSSAASSSASSVVCVCTECYERAERFSAVCVCVCCQEGAAAGAVDVAALAASVAQAPPAPEVCVCVSCLEAPGGPASMVCVCPAGGAPRSDTHFASALSSVASAPFASAAPSAASARIPSAAPSGPSVEVGGGPAALDVPSVASAFAGTLRGSAGERPESQGARSCRDGVCVCVCCAEGAGLVPRPPSADAERPVSPCSRDVPCPDAGDVPPAGAQFSGTGVCLCICCGEAAQTTLAFASKDPSVASRAAAVTGGQVVSVGPSAASAQVPSAAPSGPSVEVGGGPAALDVPSVASAFAGTLRGSAGERPESQGARSCRDGVCVCVCCAEGAGLVPRPPSADAERPVSPCSRDVPCPDAGDVPPAGAQFSGTGVCLCICCGEAAQTTLAFASKDPSVASRAAAVTGGQVVSVGPSAASAQVPSAAPSGPSVEVGGGPAALDVPSVASAFAGTLRGSAGERPESQGARSCRDGVCVCVCCAEGAGLVPRPPSADAERPVSPCSRDVPCPDAGDVPPAGAQFSGTGVCLCICCGEAAQTTLAFASKDPSVASRAAAVTGGQVVSVGPSAASAQVPSAAPSAASARIPSAALSGPSVEVASHAPSATTGPAALDVPSGASALAGTSAGAGAPASQGARVGEDGVCVCVCCAEGAGLGPRPLSATDERPVSPCVHYLPCADAGDVPPAGSAQLSGAGAGVCACICCEEAERPTGAGKEPSALHVSAAGGDEGLCVCDLGPPDQDLEAARAALAAAEAAARAGAGAEQQAAQFAEAARGLLRAARAAAARAHEERQALQRLRAELAELSSHEDYLRRAEVEEERERERVVAAAAEPQSLARLHGAMLQLAYFAQRLAERRWRRPLALRDDDGDDADDEWQLRSALDALHVLVQRATHELLEAEGADETVRASVVAVSGEAVEELERQQQQLNEEMKAATRRLAQLQQELDQCRYVDRLMLHTARSGRDLPAAAELRESLSEEALALRSSSPSLLALAAEDERRLGEVWARVSGAGRLPPAAAAAQLGEAARALDAALAAARDELAAKRASSRQLREELRLQQHKNEMLLYLDAVEEGEEMTAADSAEAMARMRSTMYELAMYEQRLDELRRAEGVEHADDGDEGDNAWQLQSRLDHLHEHLKGGEAACADSVCPEGGWPPAGGPAGPAPAPAPTPWWELTMEDYLRGGRGSGETLPKREACSGRADCACPGCAGLARGPQAGARASDELHAWARARLAATDDLPRRLRALRERALQCDLQCQRLLQARTGGGVAAAATESRACQCEAVGAGAGAGVEPCVCPAPAAAIASVPTAVPTSTPTSTPTAAKHDKCVAACPLYAHSQCQCPDDHVCPECLPQREVALAGEGAEEEQEQEEEEEVVELECISVDCAEAAALMAEVVTLRKEREQVAARLAEADTLEAALLDTVERLAAAEAAAAEAGALRDRVALLERELGGKGAGPPGEREWRQLQEERDQLLRIKSQLEGAVADQEEEIGRLTALLDRLASRRASQAGEASERERRLQQELGAARAEAAQLRAQQAEVAELESMAECLQTRMDAAADHLADMVDAEEAHADDQLAFLSGQLAAEKARSEELGARLRALEGRAAGQAASDASVAACMLPPEAEAALEEAARLRLQLQDALRERDELRRQCDAAAGIEELAGQVEKELQESAQLDSSLRDHITTVEEKGLAAHGGFDGEAAARDNVMHSLQHELYQIADNQPHTRHTIQLVQPAPIPSLTAPPQLVHNSEQTLHMQQELQRLHQQLHQQLQQMQAAAQAHSQREHELATTILAEQERVSELQRALRKEQRHALDLQSQLASHAVRAGLAVDETRLHQVSREAEQERARAQSLEQQLQQERAIIRQLKSAVLTERQRFQAAQRRDAELLQTLRLRLGEMAATAGDKLQQGSHRASTPVLPLSPVQLSSPPSSLEAALNVAPQSPVALQADAWASAEALAEVQRRLSDAQEETRGLRRRLNREQETSQQLRAELNLVRGHNDALDTQLTEVRANLAAQQAEHDRLNRRLRALEEAELRQQSRASAERTLAQERARQLETNVARLEAELAAERAVREDAVAESAQLQRDLEALRREADVAAASAATATAAAAAASVRIRSPPESPVEEPVAQRLKDMNASLDQQMRDHSKVALTLARLVEERRELQRKTNALAEQVTQLQTSEGKAHATVSRLTAEKASVMEECIALRLELARAKEELCRRHGEAADTEELENRVNHLFGRYLRAESYRKALAWQKKYLLIALGGYQQTEAYTLSRLAHVGATIPHRISEQSSGRRRQARFRSAAFVIVAIHRMKFLIQRWYRGRQIGGSTVLNHAYSESVFSGISAQGLRRGGSSAPSVSSWSVPASASVSLGAVPHSPPSHDHSSYNGRSLHRSEAARLPLWRSMDGLAGSLPRSVTPSRLAQFVERCDSLQQRLGLATAPLVTLATSPSRSPHRGEN